MLPLYEFGGSGPTLHLAVANGFPPQTYRPLLDPLTRCYRVVSLPPRPLWPDPPPPESISSWRAYGDDLLAGMREHGLTDVIAVGHSFGGVASMLAAIAEPARFRALILLDPTMLPPRTLRLIALTRALGLERRQPLVQGALRRRSRFADVDEAFAYWRTKPLFRDWPDATLRLYAESMTRPTADGGVELAWSPAWEARYYQLLFTESWRELPKLRGRMPVLCIRGTTTQAFTEASARAFRKALPEATLAEVPGHGHLFPHSAPDATRQIMETWLAEAMGEIRRSS